MSQNATDAANQVYSFSLNQTLTHITSIQNKATGPKLTFGDNSINITGGNLDMGNNKITSLKPCTDDTDAVNLSQLKASRTVVTSNDGSVTVTPSENGLTKTYDLKVNLSNVARVRSRLSCIDRHLFNRYIHRSVHIIHGTDPVQI